MNLITTVIINHTKAPLRMGTVRGVEDIAVDAGGTREFPFDVFSVLHEEFHPGFLEACENGDFEIRLKASVGKTPVILEVGQATYAAEEDIKSFKQQVTKELLELRASHNKQLLDRCEACDIRKAWKEAANKAVASKAPVGTPAPGVVVAESLFSATPEKAAAPVKAPAPAAPAEPAKKAGGFDQWNKTADKKPASTPAAAPKGVKGKK